MLSQRFVVPYGPDTRSPGFWQYTGTLIPYGSVRTIPYWVPGPLRTLTR